MPVFEGEKGPHQPAAPSGVTPQDEVLVVRFTGELFTDYEAYLKQLNLYRQRQWSCQYSGKSGLTYEEALTCEERSKGLVEKFPDVYEGPVLRLVHHATQKADDLCSTILSHFRERFVPGEDVHGLDPGLVNPCRIVREPPPEATPPSAAQQQIKQELPVSAKEHPKNGRVSAVDMEYEVEWLVHGEPSGRFAVLTRGEMLRKKSPLSRAVLSTWLQEVAVCEPVQGVKGVPCLWKAHPELEEQYDLPDMPPPDLEEKLQRAAKRKALKDKEANMRAERERALKAEATAIAMAAFAGAGHRTDVLGAALGSSGAASAEAQARAAEAKARMAALLGHSSEQSPMAAFLGSSAAVQGLLQKQEQVPERPPVPIESFEDTEARLQPGTVKRGIYDILRDCGPQGSSVASIVDGLQSSGVKVWEDQRIAKSSVASICGHDDAFARIGQGRFALRAFPGVVEVIAAPPRANFEEAAVKAIAAVEAKEAEAMAKLAQENGRIGRVDKNVFKCPKCHKTHLPDGSPLILCDSCPRSYHVACLGLRWEELPEGDWECPRCLGHNEAALKRMAEFELKKAEVLEKVVIAEKEKEDKWLKKVAERDEKERRRAEERAEKEMLKAKEKGEKERARREAKWAARYPIDDMELLQEETEAFVRAEMHSSDLAEALQRGITPSAAGVAPEDGLEWIESLHQQAAEAAEKVARLRMLIQGPPTVEFSLPEQSQWGPLMDALTVVEFLRSFGRVCEAHPLSLAELQHAAAWPLDSPKLVQLYMALLRCILLEQVGQGGPTSSRARRWARVVDETTWPEILRRYLLASRAPLGVLASAIDGVEVSALDDHAAAIVTARELGQKPFYKLDAALHLRCLAALCNDVNDGVGLRTEINARAEETMQLLADKNHQLQEEKRQLKEEEKLKKEEERLREKRQLKEEEKLKKEEERLRVEHLGQAYDNLFTVRADAEMAAVLNDDPESEDVIAGAAVRCAKLIKERVAKETEPRFELPLDLHHYTGNEANQKQFEAWQTRRARELDRLQALRATWHTLHQMRLQRAEEAEQEASQAGVEADAELRIRDDARQAREAEWDAELDKRAIRSDALGSDRYGRRYWWLAGEPAAILVESDDGLALGLITSKEQVEGIIPYLNRKGMRERGLLAALKAKRNRLAAALQPDYVAPDVHAVPRLLPGKPGREKALEDLEAALQATALRAGVANAEGLVNSVAASSAAKLAGDPNEWREMLQAAQTPAALCDALMEIERSVCVLGDGLPGGARDDQLARYLEVDQQLATGYQPAEGTDQQAEQTGGTDTPAAAHAGDGSAAEYVELAVVYPEEELDNSDEEIAKAQAAAAEGQRPPRKKHALWRSARERLVWLREARRAANTGSFTVAAYAAAVLSDRSQPLLAKLTTRYAREQEQQARAGNRKQADAVAYVSEKPDRPEYRTNARKRRASQEASAAAPAAAAAAAGPPVPVAANKRSRTDFGGALKLKIKMGGGSARGGRRGSAAGGGDTPDGPGQQSQASNGAASRASTPGLDDDSLVYNTGAVVGSEDRWMATCATCGLGGDLLCCEAPICSVAMHSGCAGLAQVPIAHWFCPEHQQLSAATPPAHAPKAGKPPTAKQKAARGKSAPKGRGKAAKGAADALRRQRSASLTTDSLASASVQGSETDVGPSGEEGQSGRAAKKRSRR
ncbi:hypothetical protein WJX72_009931 [[Myrmecia] bisecta]|uniref:Uncharacterized protein n=1 Tax=[Myrmecia] bisecta TaxID=41462 RepID=A0AAW1QSE7_9CHLO